MIMKLLMEMVLEVRLKFRVRLRASFTQLVYVNMDNSVDSITPNPEAEKYPLELNVLTLPKRLGKTKCSFYMRSGMCDYGASCRFDHPDPIFVLYHEHESLVVKGESVCKHKEGLELTNAGYVLLYSEATQWTLSVPMITVDRFMYMYPNCILDGYQAPECMEMWSSSSPPASNVENFEDYT
ncbi:zinc finger CCCH domain-containing protein 6-like protein [Tanacetum coccineum]